MRLEGRRESSVKGKDTCRLSERSALFPTNTMMTSFPLSDRTSSIHFDVDMNDWRSTPIYIGHQ